MALSRLNRDTAELLAGLRRRAVDAGPVDHLPAYDLHGGAVLPVAGGFRQGHRAHPAQRADCPAHRPAVAGADRQGQSRRPGRATARAPRRRAGRARPDARRGRGRAERRGRQGQVGSSPRRSTARRRRPRARWRRSRFSTSRSPRCAARLGRSRRRSTPRRRRKRNPRLASPISASDSTSRSRSAFRNCRAIARISSAGCGKSSATARTSASSATASSSSRRCSSTAAQAVLRPEGRAELDKLAGALLDLDQPDSGGDPVGAARRRPHRHPTDRKPAVPTNWELSAARAISVVQYLISKGVSPQRLVAAGFGEFQPIDPDHTEEAFRRNRRLELKLTER